MRASSPFPRQVQQSPSTHCDQKESQADPIRKGKKNQDSEQVTPQLRFQVTRRSIEGALRQLHAFELVKSKDIHNFRSATRGCERSTPAPAPVCRVGKDPVVVVRARSAPTKSSLDPMVCMQKRSTLSKFETGPKNSMDVC